jgi:hypothetical protein
MNTLSPISNFGALDALARLQPAALASAGAASGAASRTWFDAGHASETLVGEVEPGAQGLGVSQHAERILGPLLADQPPGSLR